ncbi:hypothetical protein VEV11M_11520 [Escherichia coli]|nr:hypothetical protein VEV11M_11520 [Escherichia coli]
MNNVFTAIQNRDGEALSRMSGYEHQYVNNDNVVNMSAERLVDALFKQLKQLFPAAVVTNLKTPEQEVAAKQQWIAAFAEGGIRTREQVSAGMRHARASESPFWPSPGQFIKWCKDSKMVLGVTIDDVMAEFHRYSKEKVYILVVPKDSRGGIRLCTGSYVIPAVQCISASLARLRLRNTRAGCSMIGRKRWLPDSRYPIR